MMKHFIWIYILILGSISCSEVKQTTHTSPPKVMEFSVMSYNVENFFDTINDPQNDDDFTPQGKLMWNTKKYVEKVSTSRKSLVLMPQKKIFLFSLD